MNSILKDIVERTRIDLSHARKMVPETLLREQASQRSDVRDFQAAVAQPGRVNIIAEIKKASPSAGVLREMFEPAHLARQYGAGGACALSVLTERHFFQGDLAHIALARRQVDIPVLRKDFIVDEYQVHAAAAAGADAVLLIAALLDHRQLTALMNAAGTYRLSCLVEVHDEDDVKRALDAGARIIGINNRDLNTFAVDLQTTMRLLPLLPPGIVAVAESGIRTNEDITRLRAAGASAFLIGETLVRSDTILQTMRGLHGQG